jgi:hypothetical protein
MQLGNVLIPSVRIFKTGDIARTTDVFGGLGHRGYNLAEFEAELPQVLLEGSLLQLYGTTRTIQQYKEDAEGLACRTAGYNSVSNVKGRSGWISVSSVDVDDETGSRWPVSIFGTWFDASQYRSELTANPVTMANSFNVTGNYDLAAITSAGDVRCFDGSTEIFSPFHIFSDNCIIRNGLYQITISANSIKVDYWDTDTYVTIDTFAAGTFSSFIVTNITTDIIEIKTSNSITITMERGRVPHISTPVPLSCTSLTPSNQSTSSDNYLTLSTGIYVASETEFSISSNTISAGNRWIFHAASDEATVAADCLVRSNLYRQVVRR